MALRREPVPTDCTTIYLRSIRNDDLAACHRIDRVTHPTGEPWPVTTWWDAAREFYGLVAAQGDLIAGFCLYELRVRSARVIKFAVHPTVQRAGVGSTILGRVVELATIKGKRFVDAVVPITVPFIPALNFMKSLGWPGHLSEDGQSVSFTKEITLKASP